jgi:hypothetical protein
MRPLYLARVEDLGRGDLAKVDSAACLHVAQLTPDPFIKLGLSPKTKALIKSRGAGCHECGESQTVVTVKWARRVPGLRSY